MGQEIQRAEGLTGDLIAAYGEEVICVVLYGSAARDQFHEGVSDLNLLVLLRSADPMLIRRGSALARRWVSEGNPPPLLLSEEELRRSLDIFPIEYSDIQEAHRVLYGADPFAELVIDREHLRLQCERELKGKLIQLREHFLLAAEEPGELGELLRRSISTFLVLFRTALRLVGDAVPPDASDVVRAVAVPAGFDPASLLEILRVRKAGTAFEPAPADPVVTGYLQAVAQTVEWVDGLGNRDPRVGDVRDVRSSAPAAPRSGEVS